MFDDRPGLGPWQVGMLATLVMVVVLLIWQLCIASFVQDLLFLHVARIDNDTARARAVQAFTQQQQQQQTPHVPPVASSQTKP